MDCSLRETSANYTYWFLKEFLRANNYEEFKKWVLSLWTTYCLIANLEVDTAAYDNKLLELYNDAMSDASVSYDEFDGDMCKLLV